jgi:hypothetical protein
VTRKPGRAVEPGRVFMLTCSNFNDRFDYDYDYDLTLLRSRILCFISLFLVGR